MPRFLLAFLVWITLSIAWSFYPGVSALGSLTQWSGAIAGTAIALCLTGAELLSCLSAVLRAILALSLVFEVIVAVGVRHPILPFWVDYGPPPYPQSFYWSRALLAHGGRIQGMVGNSNLLAMIALLAAIVIGAQLVDRRLRRGSACFWLGTAALTLALTRSSTVLLALLGVTLVLAFVVWTRRREPGARRPVYLAACAVVIGIVAAAATLRPIALAALGRSEDLTGRLAIWKAVTELAVQHPVVGWGWTSYWAPWVDPFRDLAVRRGTVYLQAHDAWLDVWFQVGVVGLALFCVLVVVTWCRAWFVAVDRPRSGIDARSPFTAADAVWLLILAALVTQSFAESRLIVEGGWLLLVVLAVRMKRLVA